MKTNTSDLNLNRLGIVPFVVIIALLSTVWAPVAPASVNSCQTVFGYSAPINYLALEKAFLESRIFTSFYNYKRKVILEKFTETQYRRGLSAYESREAKALFELAKMFKSEVSGVVHGVAAKKRFVDAWIKHERLTSLAKKMNLENSEIMAILIYSGGNYQAVNGRLRDASERAAMKSFSDFLDHSLSKLPTYDGIVRRNVSWTDEAVEALKVGQVLEHQGYTSTSKNLNFSNFGNHTKFHIMSKNGKDISHLSAISHEKEVLFMTGSKFKILAIQNGHPERTGGTKYFITMVEVD